MHYLLLFGFKTSPVQRYFFMDNLISFCRDTESKTFWRLQLKANFPKLPSNIAIAELSSPTREIFKKLTNHLMIRHLEVSLGEVLETVISLAQQFC